MIESILIPIIILQIPKKKKKENNCTNLTKSPRRRMKCGLIGKKLHSKSRNHGLKLLIPIDPLLKREKKKKPKKMKYCESYTITHAA